MSGILKLTILSTIDNLDRRKLRRVKLVYKYFGFKNNEAESITVIIRCPMLLRTGSEQSTEK
jgi:hypothetical protein